MASFKLHIARIRNCPSPADVAGAMQEFGLPEAEDYGVLDSNATDESVFATIARRTEQTVQRLDAETGEVTSRQVEKVALYTFGIQPAREALEVYSGSASAIEQIGAFLSGSLALPTVVEPIELDIADAIEKLLKSAQRPQLKSARVGDYSHNSYMSGTYAPKFLDTPNGLEFIEQHSESLKAAGVKFMGPTGRVTVNLRSTASFSFSCQEDDEPIVRSMLRKLV